MTKTLEALGYTALFLTTTGLGISNALVASFMHVGKPLLSISAVRGIGIASALIIFIPSFLLLLQAKSSTKPLCTKVLLCGFLAGLSGGCIGYISALSSKNPVATSSGITGVLVFSSIVAAAFFLLAIPCALATCDLTCTAIQDARADKILRSTEKEELLSDMD